MRELKDLIKDRRLEIGKTLEQIGNEVGVAKATVQRWESGAIKDIKHSKLVALANALRTTPSYLMGWDKAAGPAPQPAIEAVLSKIPLLNLPVSAGDGQWLAEGYEYELTSFANIPEDADFALRVRGESMAPMFSDSDIVFIKAGVIIESGQIGIFCLNGEGYLKMLQGNKLISLNKDYSPIIVEEWDTFFCAGRVVGKAYL